VRSFSPDAAGELADTMHRWLYRLLSCGVQPGFERRFVSTGGWTASSVEAHTRSIPAPAPTT